MSETWLGEKLVFRGRRRTFDVSGGWRTTEIYEGTHESVAAAEGTLTGVNYETDYATDSPVARLTITTPDTGETPTQQEGVIVTEFELVNNFDQKHAFEHWRSQALGVAEIEDIRLKLSEKKTLAQTGFSGDKATLYGMLRLNQDSFFVSQWVFKMTQLVTKKAVATITQRNMNRVYLHEAMIAETNPTPLYVTALNAARDNVLVDFYRNSIPAGNTFGWKKLAWSLNNISGNRSVISVQFGLEAWSNYYYS